VKARTLSVLIFAALLTLGLIALVAQLHSAKAGSVVKDRNGDTYTLFRVTEAHYSSEAETQCCIFTATTPKEGTIAKTFDHCPRIGELVQRQDCCDIINWGPTDHLNSALVTRKWAKQ
jgi:hypothetical protein